MVYLIRSALTGGRLNQQVIDEMQLHSLVLDADLYHLAASHSVANVLSIGLLQNGFNTENTPYERAEFHAAYYGAQIEAAMNAIRDLFGKYEVVFIPLKALVLKGFYPESSMRTCGDIDILVQKEKLTTVADFLASDLGYRAQSYDHHDVELISPDNLHVELHFSTSYDEGKLDSVLAQIWDYASPIDNGVEYKLTDVFFLFYTIAHIYHHFVTRGCGIRFFMDLWVIKYKMGIEYTDVVKELCNEAGIMKFAESALQLSEVCFEGAEHTEITRDMEKYIFSGGTFGSGENEAARTSVTAKKNGRVHYYLQRMLLPYNKLKILYPDMKGWQFPLYEVKRWGELFKKGADHRIQMARKVRELSGDKREFIKKLYQELGIE